MRRLVRCAVVLLATASVAVLPTTPASATGVCQETNRATFSPPLTMTSASGTMTFTYIKQCVRDNATVYSATGTNTFPYVGNCVNALIDGGTGRVIGGLVYIPLVLDNKAMAMVADSLNPCNFSTGALYGVKID